ncbi:DUF2778 domain-containing protein [Rhizobium daejeonense]|uniref:DUF2778 domain-containing protein n=1 Tax=Rhizobium daejeonense TaxID=240521 RepID=A0A6M1RXM0_9HYPH|nr:DUF2778 domain-containing protein [Rhizobium daejeonense]NGO63829.1 DUF2778 domain-containing protein [Rhizobium daejeonense]
MASSGKSDTRGIAPRGSAPRASNRTSSARQSWSRPTIIGVGAALGLWATAAIATVHMFTSGPSSTSTIRLESARITPVPAVRTDSKSDRRATVTANAINFAAMEEARARLAAAIADTDDVDLLMLPASMQLASVEKSDRLDLVGFDYASNPQALDGLRRDLAAAVAERTALQLAAAAEAEKQKTVQAADPVMTASIAPATATAATGPALAYAAAMPAKEVVPMGVDPREQPFVELLSEPAINDHEELPDGGPMPTAKPGQPAVSPAKPAGRRQKPATVELAYAKPGNPLVMDDEEDRPSLFSRKPKLPGRGVAVYDISAGIVHMPNGEKLEAHSGRAQMRDDPRFVHMKNRGPTPPNVYSLRMREARFHGIEAIRMTPVGDAKMYGRDGFLTHTYLLRTRGDSSGCVVFEDYNRFLNAFKRGEVKTLIVVPRMTELPKYVAMM